MKDFFVWYDGIVYQSEMVEEVMRHNAEQK